ncbi:MAG: PCI domain-containing protein [Candidatus Helarchaeota archaeon]
MTEKCAICGDPEVIFKCQDCGRNFCWSHTGSNEVFYCSKHKMRYTRETMIKYRILDEKCHIILKTLCPRCKNGLFIEKTNEDPYKLFFSCSSCKWNSYKEYPLIVSTDFKEITEKAKKELILKSNELKYCNQPLKIIEGKNERYCIGCLIDTLERGDIFPEEDIMKLTNLSKDKILPLLKDLQGQKLIKGIIDPITHVYISLTPEYKDYLINRIKLEKIDVRQLSEEIDLDERIVRLLLVNLVDNTPEISGKFIDIHTFINTDLIIDEIIELIKNGPILVSEISNKFNLKISEIKNLVGIALERGSIKAFYSPDGKTIIPGEGLQTRLMDLINEKGKIFIDMVSSRLKIQESVLRDTIRDFIKNKQIKGWYTQDKGFVTLKYLENEILSIMKIYKKITLDELSDKLKIPKQYVKNLLIDMIKNDRISGSIVDDSFERSQVIEYVKKGVSTSRFLSKKIEDAMNLQYVLIIHKESGSCVFSYPCSELEFDSDLVSGFLQAISSFGSEIDSSQSTPLEEIKWGGFVIALSDGNLVRTAFICKNSPSPSLKANIKYFILNFENKFKQNLSVWTGDIHPFRKTKDLIENFFKVGSKLLFFMPQLSKTTLSKEQLQRKILDIIEKKGRVKLIKLGQDFGLNTSTIIELLTVFVIEGIGRFTKDQSEFITEPQIMNEIGEILLSSNELKVSEIANQLNLEHNETEEILQNLINEGKINATLSDGIFKQL